MISIFFRILPFIFLSPGVQQDYSDKDLLFAHIADLHVAPATVSEMNLNNLVDDINLSDADFVIVNGDLTNTGSDSELVAVKNALDRLTKPCYVLPGNHETNWSESAGLYFNELWKGDRFMVRKSGFVLAGFNTGPFMRMGDGIIKKEDLSWLDRNLRKMVRKDDILIAFSHYPLADGLSNWDEATDILKSNGCRLCFCGHGHRLTLLNFDGIPGIMGRAVITGTSAVPGYNLVRVTSDSVIVYNKEPGVAPGVSSLAFKYTDTLSISDLKRSLRPDFAQNTLWNESIEHKTYFDDASIFCGPCEANDSLIVYSNSRGLVKAISKSNGSIKWTAKVASPVYSTPVAADGVVAFGTVDGNIMGLSAENGKILWKVTTGRPVLAEGSIGEGCLYIGGGDRNFYKIEIATGKVIWKFDSVSGLIQGKAALSDSCVVFGAWDTYLYCLSKSDGSLKWKWTNGKPQKLYSPGNIMPLISGNRVFIVAPDRFMTALDLESGRELWRTGRHMVRESSGLSADGKSVYAKLMNDTLISVSAGSGGHFTQWAVNQGFGYEHNPCPITCTDSLVLIGTRSGVLIASDPFDGRVKWRYKAGNSSVIRIVSTSDGLVWFTLAEGKIGSIRNPVR